MIPIKLSLRNFMCYRDRVTLDFEGIHLACLCGNNGAGKSALLDAITWALWGEARSTARKESQAGDDLIYIGQDEMEVELDFRVGAEHYRALRKRSKGRPGRSGQTVLELQISTPVGFRTITGNSQRETQQRIRDLLRMDYTTFINSAFLLQGRADEFATKKPSERKEILGEILGLSIYDQLQERAREHYREKEERANELTAALKRIEEELAHKEQYQDEFQQATVALQGLESRIVTQETALQELRGACQELQTKKQALAEIKGRLKEFQEAKNSLESQIAQQRQRIQEHETLLMEEKAIQQGYSQFLAAQKLNEDLSQSFRQFHLLTSQIDKLERAVNEARHGLLAEQQNHQGRAKLLEAIAQKIPQIERELQQAQKQLEGLPRLHEELEKKKTLEQELSNQTHLLKSANIQLREEMKALKGKIDLLNQGDARCPLCESELGIGGRERIQKKYEAEGKAKAETYRANERQIQTLEKEWQALKAELTQTETELNRKRTLCQGMIMALERSLDEARRNSAEAAQSQRLAAEIGEKLARADYAPAEQTALQSLRAQITSLSYDQAKHEAAVAKVKELGKYQELHRKLEEARSLLAVEQQSLAQNQKQLDHWHLAIQSETERQARLSQEVSVLPDLEARLAREEITYRGLTNQRTELQRRLWQAQQKLAHCAELEEQKKVTLDSLRRASREKEIYEELVRAFGKGGIQALLIESALPEIEEEANRLLNRMTDNRMHIKLETQRDTKKGNTIETLDIKTSDELGTRSYELYSGGEAFRINFALRVALAKLLARRAGAPLPTLVIDEGFGTQDNSGRERLVEAINSIQNDFEKIIVVTHIDELKDQFPVRIEVTKTAEGSRLSVN